MSNLTIKVSNPMLNVLRKSLPEEHYIRLERLTERQYKWHVDYNDPFYYHSKDVDNKGNFKVFRITYPVEYYAMDRFITSKDLNEVFNEYQPKTLEEYVQRFNEYIEV